jgi:hypothetical protein
MIGMMDCWLDVSRYMTMEIKDQIKEDRRVYSEQDFIDGVVNIMISMITMQSSVKIARNIRNGFKFKKRWAKAHVVHPYLESCELHQVIEKVEK